VSEAAGSLIRMAANQHLVSGYGRADVDDDFTLGLDQTVWTPAYLPAWSSRAAARADWMTGPHGLTLRIPPDHPIWCEADHRPRLRVSAVQSANWSGPLGSTRGQQPFTEGQVVREEQRPAWGVTPRYGHVSVTCRADLMPGAMFSAWLIGLEDRPERCGEICLVEVFGSTIGHGPDVTAEVGRGVHRFRDPSLTEDFAAPTTTVDVSVAHTYAVDWTPDRVDFLLDGAVVHTSRQSPDYPMQLMIAIFDFPDDRADRDVIPGLHVARVSVARH
jgi:glycosyl hydrolase family 16